MRGQFIRGDGLIIPNNVSLAGAQAILKAAFRHDVQEWWAGLVAGSPTLDMTIADFNEPTIGTNGYARINIPQNDTGWQIIAAYGNEMYVESGWLTWTATNDGFDKPIQRIALLGAATYNVADDVFALSVPMPAEVRITPSTPEAQRKFKYQLFM